MIGYHLPDNITEEELKIKIEKKFSMFNVKIAYINYTYDIENFIKST